MLDVHDVSTWIKFLDMDSPSGRPRRSTWTSQVSNLDTFSVQLRRPRRIFLKRYLPFVECCQLSLELLFKVVTLRGVATLVSFCVTTVTGAAVFSHGVLLSLVLLLFPFLKAPGSTFSLWGLVFLWVCLTWYLILLYCETSFSFKSSFYSFIECQ